MCTGRPPFRAGGAMAVLKRVCEERPTPICESNPGIPGWLAAIIDRLHAKDPAQRYQSAAEVAEVLGRRLAHVPPPGWARVRGRRPWVITAAVLFCAVAALALAEAAGVTDLRGTVIRAFGPDGTLVVKPAVAKAEKGAFVVLGGGGVAGRSSDTL